ncbi:unnamed protein product [Adineta ricciae]|uniref:Uncharacterized protein n=1 Tax=Adineta ricciae TaxID=249248 RepID=A0A814B6H1_ADIRI|nr:unnamed protein product [Adineta ricciae]
MKLDNVDFDKLKFADIPKFVKCPCELCDDGCYEKCGNEHYPECKHRPQQRTKLSRSARCPQTHYQQIFVPIRGDHRRQLCPPVPDNEIPTSFKNLSMSTTNTQKEHYPPPPVGTAKQKPASPAKQTDKYLVSGGSVPMETQTHYQTEYSEKPVGSVVHRTSKDVTRTSQVNITDSSAPLASKTTSHTHFKQWQPIAAHPYTEMPAIAGHILFPDGNRSFDTTTGRTFVPYPNVSRTRPVIRPEYQGNLTVTGDMDLHTNYRREFTTPKSTSLRSAPVKPPDALREEKVYTRRPMNEISQTSYDFRPRSYQRPPQTFDMEPFQSQVNIGDSQAPLPKDTQYRLDYPGYDAKKHHRPPAMAPKGQQYVAPVEKMDSLTVTQRDFQPIDVSTLPRIHAEPLKANLSVRDNTGPMESVTMSHYHYQPYKPVTVRRQYGEIVPNIYVPRMEKFQGSTTTGDAFQGRPGKPAQPIIPEVRMVSQKGKHDHNTNYRMDYHPHGLSVCAAKAFTIVQRKEANPISISIQ